MKRNPPLDRKDVELHARETLLEGFTRVDRFHLRHRLHAGGWSAKVSREVQLRGAVAAVIPYDPVRDMVVLIEQFRGGLFAADDPYPWSTEIVAGIVEPGESPDEMARRETLEEAGCTIGRLEQVMEFYSSPGGSTQRVVMFCGEVSSDGVEGVYGLASEGEDIRAFAFPAGDVLELVGNGTINNAVGIVGLQWLAMNRTALRHRWT
jgi:ADP-ribose pyrophosphatase